MLPLSLSEPIHKRQYYQTKTTAARTLELILLYIQTVINETVCVSHTIQFKNNLPTGSLVIYDGEKCQHSQYKT